MPGRGPDHQGAPGPDTAIQPLLLITWRAVHASNDLAGASRYYEQALKIRREAKGDKDPETVQVLNNLGSVLRQRGELAAPCREFRRARSRKLKVFRAAFGAKHRETANVLNNLAGVLEDQGDYPQARKLYEEALAVRQEVLGDKHPDVLRNR